MAEQIKANEGDKEKAFSRAQFEEQYGNLQKAFYAMIKEDNIRAVLFLITQDDVNVNAADPDELMPPLHTAAQQGQVNLVNALLTSPKIDIHLQFDISMHYFLGNESVTRSPLQMAILNNHLDIAEILINREETTVSSDPEKSRRQYDYLNSALQTAAFCGHRAMVAKLLPFLKQLTVNNPASQEQGFLSYYQILSLTLESALGSQSVPLVEFIVKEGGVISFTDVFIKMMLWGYYKPGVRLENAIVLTNYIIRNLAKPDMLLQLYKALYNEFDKIASTNNAEPVKALLQLEQDVKKLLSTQHTGELPVSDNEWNIKLYEALRSHTNSVSLPMLKILFNRLNDSTVTLPQSNTSEAVVLTRTNIVNQALNAAVSVYCDINTDKWIDNVIHQNASSPEDVITYLISQGANVNETDHLGFTPLDTAFAQIATLHENVTPNERVERAIQCINCLVKHGADTIIDENTSVERLQTVFWTLLKRNVIPVVEMLLGFDEINILTLRDPRGISALELCVQQNNIELLKVCLKSLSQQTPKGNDLAVMVYQALETAITHNRLPLVQQLVKAPGVSFNLSYFGKLLNDAIDGILNTLEIRENVGDDKQATLDESMARQLEIIDYLISQGANVNSYDNKGQTLLHRIINSIKDNATETFVKNTKPLLKLLIEKGADIHQLPPPQFDRIMMSSTTTLPMQQSPLEYATQLGLDETVKWFKEVQKSVEIEYYKKGRQFGLELYSSAEKEKEKVGGHLLELTGIGTAKILTSASERLQNQFMQGFYVTVEKHAEETRKQALKEAPVSQHKRRSQRS